MKDEKDFLYQDLPSLKPRVSREERLSMQRNSGCVDCNPHLSKAKKGAKNLYFFYIAILGVGFIGIQIHQRLQKNSVPTIQTEYKQLSISFSKKINVTLIEQQNRYGLSILFRNNSNQEWTVNSLQLIIKNTDINQTINLNTKIEGKTFLTTFIPLNQKIKHINDVEVSITP